jgi:preprotein translocase subunit SecE
MHKPGQGKWTRGVTAAGVGVIVAFGIHWLLEELKGVAGINEFVLAGIAVLIVALFGALTWWLLNKPVIVDFMIATESEMRKVNWPTRKEIIGSTWVVIIGTFLVTTFLFIIDFSFAALFTLLKVIDIGGS